MSRILFVSPHPDDETLGCGGTILKHRSGGDEVYWLIMTNILVEEGYNKVKVDKRQKEIDSVANEYKFSKVFKLNFPTAKLDVIPRIRIISETSRIIEQVKPEMIYLPNGNDVHSDHGITFEAIISSTKTFRCPFIKKMLVYEVISETEFSPPLGNNAFLPNSFTDITDYIDKKISIMKLYRDEIKKHPFPRSVDNIRALATFRGATAGVRYAEAFTVLKEIW